MVAGYILSYLHPGFSNPKAIEYATELPFLILSPLIHESSFGLTYCLVVWAY